MGSVFLLLPQKHHSIGVERHLDADTVKWQWSQGKSFLYFLLMWRTYLSHRWGYCIFFCTAMLWCYRGQKNTGGNWLCKTSLAVILQTWSLIMCKTRMWYQQEQMNLVWEKCQATSIIYRDVYSKDHQDKTENRCARLLLHNNKTPF